MRVLTFSAILIALALSTTLAQQLAFPTAEGYGKYTQGGRGGVVYEVTNLNDSGEGSLRAAVEAEGPRTVVFRISGTIDLKSNLEIKNPHITIAGQTAPGDGITLKRHPLIIRADEVIIRYIRVRLGDETGEAEDAITSRYTNNIILDHVSASWSIDETLSIYHCKNVTVQWCMITESLYESNHTKGSDHGYGGIWGSDYSTYHHNLIAHHSSRNPRFASGCGNTDYRNNVVYNWGYKSTYGGEVQQVGSSKFNFTNINMVANYYKPGPATVPGEVSSQLANPWSRNGDADYGKWFIGENIMEDSEEVTADNWKGVMPSLTAIKGVQEEMPKNPSAIHRLKLDRPWEAMPINQETAEETYQSVLEHAGASLPNRDAVDIRIIDEVKNGFATYEGETYKKDHKVADRSRQTGIIDSQEQVGGWPELKSVPAPIDSDHDGMPDAWEKEMSLNPNDASDGTKDRNEDGYTNLEEYLNSLVDISASNMTSLSPGKRAIVQEEFVFTKGPTRDCHASSLLELENGDLLCTWFGGTREGHHDVNIWLARKPRNGKWQPPVSICDMGDQTLFNPVLVQSKGDDIQIYFVSPGIDDGQVITSDDNGYNWSKPSALPEGFVGPIVNKPVYLADGTIVAGSSLQGEPGKRIHVERSTDNGKTWTKVGPISDPVNTKYEIIQPTILVYSPKRLQILARTNEKHEDAKMAQTWSEDGGLTWSPVTDATLPNNNSAIDGVTLKDGRQLLVYNHSTREDSIGGRKGRGILTVAVSNDGINWEAAAVLEYRTGSVQYSYPAVIQTEDGLIHITYSWHRKRIKHVVLDPARLVTFPIIDGKWPKDKMPWVVSRESEEAGVNSELLE